MGTTEGRARVSCRYRQPSWPWVVGLAVMVVLVVRDLVDGWAFVPLLFTAAINRPQGLELTPEWAVIRRFRTQRIRWSDVIGIEPANVVGLRLHTARGVFWSNAPASWWGGPATRAQVTAVAEWWWRHRGTAPLLPPPPVVRPSAARPCRVSGLLRALALVGVVVAAANGIALLAPFGTWTIGGLTVNEPDLDHLPLLVLVACCIGVIGGAVASVLGYRAAQAASATLGPTDDAVHTAPACVVATAVGLAVAALQRFGVVPAILALGSMVLGLLGAVAGCALLHLTRRMERDGALALYLSEPFHRGRVLASPVRTRGSP